MLSFKLPSPANLMIDVEGHKPLLLYANPPETANPGGKPGVRYFKAGQVYEVGELTLDKGEHLYIEGVENVLVQKCIFMNDRAGNVVEVGHELRTDTIRNITFRDCDYLHGSHPAASVLICVHRGVLAGWLPLLS